MYSEQESYFVKMLIEHLPHCVFWKDKNLVFRGCNRLYAKQFGYDTLEELIGKTDADLPSTPFLLNKYVEDDKKIMSTGKALLNYEEEQKQLDGSIKIVLVSKVPIYNKNHEPLGVLGIYTDVTEKKRSEQRAKELAEKTVNFANMLAGSIAHELRNPLMGINAQMDLLRLIMSHKKPIEEKEAACLTTVDNVKKAIKKASHVMDDILLKVRSYASGKMASNFVSTSIKDDVNDVLASYPFQNKEKDLITVDYKNCFVYKGDEILTRHVLSNLIKNSLHAILESSNKGKITIKFKNDNKFHYLVFKDTGHGISKKFLPKIFNPFETGKIIRGGTGLGLAFCKMVMQSYNGNITCKSQQGKYTEFTLSFPK